VFLNKPVKKQFYLVFIEFSSQNLFFTNRKGMHIQCLSDLLSNINIV